MIEGPEAWTRCCDAVKKGLTVPKSARPESFRQAQKWLAR